MPSAHTRAVGRVLEKARGRQDAVFPTPAADIDWKKSTVKVIQLPKPPVQPLPWYLRLWAFFRRPRS